MQKKKFGWMPQLILLVVIVAIIVVVILRLKKWNESTVEIDHNIDPTAYETESLDLSFHIDQDILAAHGDDGVNRMLVMGNYMVKRDEDGKSIIDNMRKSMPDWEITDISAYQSMVTAPTYISDDEFPGGHFWSPFSLYYLAKGLCTRDYAIQEYNLYDNGSLTIEDADEYLKLYESIDLNDYDVLLIMYASTDYYQMQTLYNDADEMDVTTYMGSLRSTFKLLNECYPHLRVVVSSPFMTYCEMDGERAMGTLTNFGSGTESEYVMREYYVCTEYCISFIDNYFNYITEKNLDKYVEYNKLNADGIEAVSNHIIEFLKD